MASDSGCFGATAAPGAAAVVFRRGRCVVGSQLRLERLDELAEQLFRNLLQHTAAELGELADDLQVGVYGDPGVIARVVQLGGDGRGRVAGAARLLALAVDDGAVLVTILFDEVHLAAELTGHRAHLDLDLAEHVVAVTARHLRSRHQRDDLLEIGEHIPGVLDRDTDGELVGDLHRAFLSGGAVLRERVADQCVVVGSLGQRAQAGQTSFGVGGDKVGHPERDEGGHPVDRLRHAGGLVKVETPCPADELGGVLDECGACAGHRAAHDAAARTGSG